MNNKSLLKTVTICFSAALLGGGVAHAQIPPQNLVFTEDSSTVVTETLNGNSIGNWQVFISAYAPEYLIHNTVTPGTLVDISSSGAGLDFLDPVYAGNYFFYNSSSDLIGTDVPASVINGDFYPVSGVSDYLPFSQTGAEVETATGGLVPVNITVEGPGTGSVPDVCSSMFLMSLGFGGLAALRRRFGKA